MSTHAKLGASSAYRWIACPGSIREIDKLPAHAKEGRSVYAAEGSAAHVLGAHILDHAPSTEDWRAAKYVGHWINPETEEMVPSEGHALLHGGSGSTAGSVPAWFEVTDEMAEAVQVYLDEIFAQLKSMNDPVLRVEQRFKLDWLRPDMWGTADAVVAEEYGELIVTDYKHGSGVPVEVEYNEQAMYYALGALGEVGADFVSKVTIVVVQPRCPHVDGPVRRWSITPEELMQWSETLGLAADATREPRAPVNAGSHCRFCPAKPACPALRGLIASECNFPDDLEDSKPTLPDPTDPEQIARAMTILPLVNDWCKAVDGMAQRALEAGHRVPGFKLVRKRANRKWEDEEVVTKKLRAKKGVCADDFLKPRTLKSPAQIEKVVGKPWVKKHSVKPEGGLTVAPEGDGRPAELAPSTTFPDLPALEPGEAAEAPQTPELGVPVWPTVELVSGEGAREPVPMEPATGTEILEAMAAGVAEVAGTAEDEEDSWLGI